MFARETGQTKSNHDGEDDDDKHLRRTRDFRDIDDIDQISDEREHFLMKKKNRNSSNQARGAPEKKASGKQAKLAREETIDLTESPAPGCCCYPRMVLLCNFIRRRRLLVLAIVVILLVSAIYCIPYVEIDPRTTAKLPQIPFNFRDGPLKASDASKLKFDRLFYGQIHGPESVALDSQGNMYMAVEGGFIMYAHLNKSSPIKRSYYDVANLARSTYVTPIAELGAGYPAAPVMSSLLQLADIPELVKIAELNAIKQIPYEHHKRRARDHHEGSWRRECQLDEKIYGSQLATFKEFSQHAQVTGLNEIDTGNERLVKKFVSNVVISRCSKPLGLRLSPDENYLYVIDTLSGLYRVNLKMPDRPNSMQRLVNKLIDFRANKHQLLPIANSPLPVTTTTTTTTAASAQQVTTQQPKPAARAGRHLNISLQAIDDLAIDYGAGTRGGDIIYLSVGSQTWIAVSFLYDVLEGKPSGAILRFDTGSTQLSVLDPGKVAHVRTTSLDQVNEARLFTPYQVNSTADSLLGIGAPRLDENDVFDDRPLHFPNGLEFTDDRQAILIADTANKRIIKHYVQGPRKGNSDLWAWTPNFPDNIRRGSDRRHETYWVVGCGQETSDSMFHVDLMALLRTYPRIRKYILKNVYLFGWIIESIGEHLLGSTSVRDFGYSLKIGHSLCESMCHGMMILQYNKYGDIIRSIHSREFSNDLVYYSQVNELIDAQNQEHVLYLGSPAYKYVTKLTLPTESIVTAPNV